MLYNAGALWSTEPKTVSVVFQFEGAGCVGAVQRGAPALGPGTVTLDRLSHPGGGLNHSSG